MALHITFRKTKATDALKQHVEKRVKKFEKFISYPTEIHVFLSIEKTFQTAEITIHAEHKEMVAIAKSKDLYESVDMVVHKLEGQLRKSREKKKGHLKAHLAVRPSSLKLARDVQADIPHREKKATT